MSTGWQKLSGSKKKKKSGETYHKVVKGDTVYALSKAYGSTIKEIKKWNNLDDDYTIRVGERLRVK